MSACKQTVISHVDAGKEQMVSQSFGLHEYLPLERLSLVPEVFIALEVPVSNLRYIFNL